MPKVPWLDTLHSATCIYLWSLTKAMLSTDDESYRHHPYMLKWELMPKAGYWSRLLQSSRPENNTIMCHHHQIWANMACALLEKHKNVILFHQPASKRVNEWAVELWQAAEKKTSCSKQVLAGQAKMMAVVHGGGSQIDRWKTRKSMLLCLPWAHHGAYTYACTYFCQLAGIQNY